VSSPGVFINFWPRLDHKCSSITADILINDSKSYENLPAKMQIRAVRWVNRETVLDGFGRIPQEGERLEKRAASLFG
jgi:hypothetical protein